MEIAVDRSSTRGGAVPGHDLVTIGASAGGLEALTALVQGLPRDLPAAVFVAVHITPTATSMLPAILSRSGSLPAEHPADEQRIEPGRIYVAPPDHHLLIRRDRVRVSRGPRENGHRPAIDPLFRSAAVFGGPRAIGIVLSGNLDDGSAGLAAIKQRGGVALVQDPEEAAFSSMPRSALEYVAVDACLPAADLADEIVRWVGTPAPLGDEAVADEDMRTEAGMAELDPAAIGDEHVHPGTPSTYGCPECGGVLWELHDGQLIRFRCRIGHAYSPDSLLAQQSEQLEDALWAALRALEEEHSLCLRLANRAAERGSRVVDDFRARATDAARRAELVRTVLEGGPPTGTSAPARASAARRKSVNGPARSKDRP